ncbi:winged helix-turn-helix transcriptional regulator [Mobilicoccus caccae]|uniref:HTH hxlR-type domain-containing protein n=1 Tax=Mobilicoccus caccae TaxID=1859295 RepID=A0ABQ6IU85_9MICO|nr:helix-turn-helix domain-containing protein [Mobilicoccus caccae]GMA40248.1 hypothetical protein GCM10025883_22930 [Mobilicoccus caccae]
MPIKRTYAQHGDACAAAHSMEILGDRWTYPVLRELMLGPKRFGEIAACVRGITPAVLTGRLREMERNGLVEHDQLPPPANVEVYDATPWARELAPIFEQLGRWAQRSPTRTVHGCGLTPDATVQSMLTMAPPRSVDPPLDVDLHLHDARIGHDGYHYRAHWGDRLTIERTNGRSGAPAGLSADSTTWANALYLGTGLDEIETDGAVEEIRRLVDAFSPAGP